MIRKHGGSPTGLGNGARAATGPAIVTAAGLVTWALADAVFCAGLAAAQDRSGLQPMPGLREEVLLRGAVVTGGVLDLNRFEDRRSPDHLGQEVRRLWGRRSSPVHALERDGWLVLVQAVDDAVETIEIRARGTGAEGRRSRLSRADRDAPDSSGWIEQVLPPGSKVLERITHRDGDRAMTTVVATSASPADQLVQSLLAALARRGCAIPLGGTPSFRGARGVAQFLARGSEELALTISEQQGQRAVVMHWGRR